MSKVTTFFTTLLFIGIGGLAHAQVVNLNPAKDNTLYDNKAGAISNGSGDYIFAGNALGPTPRRALMQYDIAGNIPAGATITSVQLTLNMTRTIAGDTDMTLHRVTADWGEGTSDAGGQEGGGWPAAPGDATWLHTFFDTNIWTNPGGDFAAGPSATATVGGLGLYSWGTSTGMVADVQFWLDNPSQNFGWILIGDETQTPSAKRFDSRENVTTPAIAPQLRIQFIPLPVELVAFNALVQNTDVHLTWVTATETDNAGFEIQQATVFADQGVVKWNTVGYVPGTGTTHEAQAYAYTVAELPPGQHLFRLKQVDFDGAFEFSNELETTIDLPGTHLLGAAYPNPFNPSTTFSLMVAQSQPVRASVHDALGREVRTLFAGELEANTQHRFTINGTNLPSGLYLYRVAGTHFSESRQVLLLK